jgi:hypothetical protein
MGVNLGRFLAERCNTPIWWRSARFSNSRAARERKIEHKVAKRVAKEISIGGESYDSSIIPVRSDISRFSRGTVSNQMQSCRYSKMRRKSSHWPEHREQTTWKS